MNCGRKVVKNKIVLGFDSITKPPCPKVVRRATRLAAAPAAGARAARPGARQSRSPSQTR